MSTGERANNERRESTASAAASRNLKVWRVYYTVDSFEPTLLGTIEATDRAAAGLVAGSRWPGLDPFLIQAAGDRYRRLK